MPDEQGILVGDAASFVAARTVGVLATADAAGTPYAVPICYDWDGHELWIALDAKPKAVTDVRHLRRVRNILARPMVSVVVQDYLTAAWEELAYVILWGTARIVAPADDGHTAAIARLRAKYPQYQAMPIDQLPAIAIQPTRVSAWGAVGPRADRPATLEADIRGRRSVRRFMAQPVARAQIMRVLEAAGWAPSPHGRQPWRFAVVTQPARRERLAAAMGAEWQATLAQDGEPPEVVAARMAASRERIRSAPALIVPCLYLADLDVYPDAARQEAETTMAVQSLGAAIQNMLLLAYHEGLDMGWMCAPLFAPAAVRAALDLPANWLPQALLPLGYAATDPKRRPRLPLEALVNWD
ncbi:MAG: nitroreductase family protein [Ktedonobacterales bacterium]|nr:nitroreductase family protein [Ktedonobacterales bacterium]